MVFDEFEVIEYAWPKDQLARSKAQVDVKAGQKVWAIQHRSSGRYFYYAYVIQAGPERVLMKWVTGVSSLPSLQHNFRESPAVVSNYDGSY